MIRLILLISRLQTDIIQIKLILVTPSIDKNNYSVRPMAEQDVRAILLWRYDEPYNFYNPPQQYEADHYVRQFLDPELMFHAVVDIADTVCTLEQMVEILFYMIYLHLALTGPNNP